ncbi:MAG: hypothetical protein P4L31_02525 [Candidatus Babeliales bacterium]|nr:hypothetical protein [Candidatus Babeliales bacterium]
MQHKNVVTFAVLVLASFSIHASKSCPLGKNVCAAKSTVVAGANSVAGKTVAVLDNKNVNRASNAFVLGTVAYAAVKYGPDFFRQGYQVVRNRWNRSAAPAAASAAAAKASAAPAAANA